jgi:hypothetical protein
VNGMGYDLHITRTPVGAECVGDPISLEEWIRYVGSDNELDTEAAFEFETENGVRVKLPREGMVRWRGHPKCAMGGAPPLLVWMSGDITASNPDKVTAAKMTAIAKTLGACVQGDEGEFYCEDTGN